MKKCILVNATQAAENRVPLLSPAVVVDTAAIVWSAYWSPGYCNPEKILSLCGDVVEWITVKSNAI